MGRKVFISVLGSGYYHEVIYYFRDEKHRNTGQTRFVQEAIIKDYCNDWTTEDQAIFFTTKGENGSKEKNWNKLAQKGHPSGGYDGLSARLQKLNLPFPIKTVDIPDGFSEDEIWEIFQTVFDEINDNDEIFFDVTHAFRSIPIFLMVLVNYAKFLKTIRVKNIFYGAFEKLGPAHDVKKIPVSIRFTPVLDLTSLSELQDWTSAANDFIKNGNIDLLVGLSNREINPILKESRGKDESASRLKSLNKSLPSFIKNIQTCRGLKIFENKEGVELNNVFSTYKQTLIKPLAPILGKISEQIQPFDQTENISNGFMAVKWCLKNGLIQQGITILKESVTTLVCEECSLDFRIEVNRNIVDSVFKIVSYDLPEKEWRGDAAVCPEITRMIIKKSKIVFLLRNEFSQIRQIRNDINHAGFKVDSIVKPEKFEDKLERILNAVLSKIN